MNTSIIRDARDPLQCASDAKRIAGTLPDMRFYFIA